MRVAARHRYRTRSESQRYDPGPDPSAVRGSEHCGGQPHIVPCPTWLTTNATSGSTWSCGTNWARDGVTRKVELVGPDRAEGHEHSNGEICQCIDNALEHLRLAHVSRAEPDEDQRRVAPRKLDLNVGRTRHRRPHIVEVRPFPRASTSYAIAKTPISVEERVVHTPDRGESPARCDGCCARSGSPCDNQPRRPPPPRRPGCARERHMGGPTPSLRTGRCSPSRRPAHGPERGDRSHPATPSPG